MAYDAQAPGWYLKNLEDGALPGGAKGSVTKVATKKGVGITETVVAAATAVGNEIDPDVLEAAGTVVEAAPGGCCTIS